MSSFGFRAQRWAAVLLAGVALVGFLIVSVLAVPDSHPGSVPSARAGPVGAIAALASLVLMFRFRDRAGAWVAAAGSALVLVVAAFPAPEIPALRGAQDISMWVAPLVLSALLGWRKSVGGP